MKNLFLLSFVFLVSLTFTIQQSQLQISHKAYNITSTGSCSDQRLKLVNQSIQACQTLLVYNYALCIKDYMYNHTNQQKWNVIVQASNSDIKQSYWFYNDCSIRVEWPYPNVIVIIWKASPSQSSQKLLDEQNHKQNNQLQKIEDDQDCTPERLAGAFYAVNYCQNNDSSLQVICIKNNIMTRMGQKWNAVVYKIALTFGMKYDYYNGCNSTVNKYGHNNRTYVTWKAQ